MAEHWLNILLFLLTLAALVTLSGPANLRRRLSRLFPAFHPERFACRVLLVEEEKDAVYRDVLKIQIHGAIRAPHSRCETNILIQLTDATKKNSAPKPVLCRHPAWSSDGTPAYQYMFHNGPLPARLSVLKDWVTVAEVEVNELVFPRRGPALLECEVTVLEEAVGKPLASARSQISLLSGQYGYEEIQQQRLSKQTAMQQLAEAVWHLTAPNPAGWELLCQWLHQGQETGPQPPPRPKSTEESISAMEEACEQLPGYAEPADCCGIFELCIRIAGSASMISQSLLKTLRYIAEKLEIPQDRYESLVQKHLTGKAEQIEEPLALLGLSEEMSEQQIMEKLTAEYRKWNARVNNPDAAVRQQADQMLNLIAQCRSRLTRRVQSAGADSKALSSEG
ncbi:MAG TPA: hypothetical protein P5017_07400 [Anaerohalosphaeraceae bacterium]|nr:hypothetical protein [Anaerohalosphaeraceae bacterium]